MAETGDKVRFRSLKQVWDPEKQAYKVDEKTYATSRFVQKKNELNISSINSRMISSVMLS